MIRKLRLKFVAVCMLLITVVLTGIFVSVHAVARSSIQRNSQAVLQRVITQDNRFADDQETLFGGNQVKLPYFTVELWGSHNTAYVTGGTYANLQDTEELAHILSECLAQNRTEGTIGRYHLRYLRMETPLYARIAFVDISAEEAAISNLVTSFFQIAFVTLAVLLVVTILLARWATRPVEKAWQQQYRFLADASHELKTPLTVILSNAELMRSQPLDPRLERWTDNIHSEATQMKALVEDMLTLARADNMGPSITFVSVSLSDLATDCALLFEPVAFEAGKALEDAITPDLTIQGDAKRLKQLISILLDNAVKYGREGTAIVLTLEKAERSARLTVANQGEPIPPEQLSRLFERFYRADVSRGEKKGFGLGLSIAAAIAQEHKGTLHAESDAASTRFIFTVPLKK